eukprot:5956107-Prymnesium_polylepis.2
MVRAVAQATAGRGGLPQAHSYHARRAGGRHRRRGRRASRRDGGASGCCVALDHRAEASRGRHRAAGPAHPPGRQRWATACTPTISSLLGSLPCALCLHPPCGLSPICPQRTSRCCRTSLTRSTRPTRSSSSVRPPPLVERNLRRPCSLRPPIPTTSTTQRYLDTIIRAIVAPHSF